LALVKLKRVLITGFEPFHKATQNPSKAVVEQLSHPAIVARAVLPVVFGEAARILNELIDEHRPDVVISLGQAEGRKEISVERIAINLDDARIADNAGNVPVDKAIVEGGPSAYFATLPTKELVEVIRKNGGAASISLSAGAFVCNHIFYSMLHYCREREIQAGFIHLPLMKQQAPEFPGLPTMDLDEMLKSLTSAIDYLVS
jgi:pyroglutamyl-peptidase